MTSLGFDYGTKELQLVQADEETLKNEEKGFDMVVSYNNLQFNTEMEMSLINILDNLIEDGCFLGCLPGSDTLSELRNVFYIVENERFGGYSQRVLKFPDATFFSNSLGRIGYRMSAVHSKFDEILFSDIFDLMHELQDKGLSQCLLNSDSRISKDLFIASSAVYKNLYYPKFDRSKIKATLQNLVFIGYKQKEGQTYRIRQTVNIKDFKEYIENDPEIKDRVKFGTISEDDPINNEENN